MILTEFSPLFFYKEWIHIEERQSCPENTFQRKNLLPLASKIHCSHREQGLSFKTVPCYKKGSWQQGNYLFSKDGALEKISAKTCGYSHLPEVWNLNDINIGCYILMMFPIIIIVLYLFVRILWSENTPALCYSKLLSKNFVHNCLIYVILFSGTKKFLLCLVYKLAVWWLCCLMIMLWSSSCNWTLLMVAAGQQNVLPLLALHSFDTFRREIRGA